MGEEVYRAPLCEMSAAKKGQLAECLRELGIV